MEVVKTDAKTVETPPQETAPDQAEENTKKENPYEAVQRLAALQRMKT